IHPKENIKNTLSTIEQILSFNFLNYLTTSELLPNLTVKKQQQFKKQATHYIVENNQLYKKPKGSLQKLLHVVQKSELLTVLHELDSDILAKHFDINKTYNSITPLDLALSSTSNAEKPPYEQQLQVHIDLITNKLQQVQLKAQQNIETAQQKQKERHDKHVKKTFFHIGNKVLLYQSAQAK
ncbi:1024_t:CDS:2, partial [Cetraspora pellucida]